VIEFIAHWILTAALLLLVSNLVRGVQVSSWGAAFLGAIVLGLVNAFVRPGGRAFSAYAVRSATSCC